MRTKSQELSPLQRFHLCCNSSLKLKEKSNRKRQGGPGSEDNYLRTSPTQQDFNGIKKLAQKFNRATVLVLKHTDTLINLDMHQFLNTDPIKRLDPETKYRRLRKYFIERWGPHSSLDVSKIKAYLTSTRGDDPGWRKYLQNFNYFVGSLKQTLQRDANDAIIYGPASASEYPARPLVTAPTAEHTAYIVACQLADEIRNAKFPHGGPALNHKPTDVELKTHRDNPPGCASNINNRHCTSSTATAVAPGRRTKTFTTTFMT